MNIVEILSVVPGLNICAYDTGKKPIGNSGKDLSENFPADRTVFNAFIEESDYLDILLEYGASNSAPYIISNYLGLVWEAVFDKRENVLQAIYIIGPVFYNPYSDEEMNAMLKSYEKRGMNLASQRQILKAMKNLPVMSYTQFGHYALMLHYALNGDRTDINDFVILSDTDHKPHPVAGSNDPQAYRDKSINNEAVEIDEIVYESCYTSQQYFLDEVKTGQQGINASLIKEMTAKGTFSLMPTLSANLKEPLRMQKDSLIIFNAMECHAAIAGGVLPAVAYRQQDRFISDIESLHSPLGLNQLHSRIHQAYCDLVNENSDTGTYSQEVRLCMDYLNQNPCRKFSSAALSKLCGYSNYYINRKFKAQVGMTPQEYFRNIKINYARDLLANSDKTITDIADMLGYSSHAHFSEDFKKITGHVPSYYKAGKLSD